MKKIYVCSRLAGDYEANTDAAREYCAYVMRECGAIPVAPHLLFPQFLDDTDPADRELGQEAGLELLEVCDELWYFGDSVSQGMVREICAAKEMGIPVRYVPEEEWNNDRHHEKEVLMSL